jgi:hypothetical protein
MVFCGGGMRIVLCCGDRKWDDEEKIYRTLKHEHKKRPIAFVIEGGQVSTKEEMVGPGLREHDWRPKKYGADHQAKLAAQRLSIQVIECPANWTKFKKAAGPIRNQKQLDVAYELSCHGVLPPGQHLPNMVVFAFHKNIHKSRGTRHMVKLAKKAKVKVRIIT